MIRYLDLSCWMGSFRFEFTSDMATHISLFAKGLYAFLSPTIRQNVWTVEYIGQAEDLYERLTNHERWPDATRRGATHVAVCVGKFDGMLTIDSIERELIGTYNPSMNEHHRTTGALDQDFSDLAGLGMARNRRRGLGGIGSYSSPARGFGFDPGAKPSNSGIRGLGSISSLEPETFTGLLRK